MDPRWQFPSMPHELGVDMTVSEQFVAGAGDAPAVAAFVPDVAPSPAAALAVPLPVPPAPAMPTAPDAADASAVVPESDSDPENIPLSVHHMSATNAVGGTFGLGLDQFELPKAPIAKVARAAMPASMQLRKELNTALVKSASVFVSYLTAAAHDVATAGGNKTIGAAHVLDALRELEFPGDMRRELRAQLQGASMLTAYRDAQKEKSDAARQQRKARQARAMDVDGDASAADTSAADTSVVNTSVADDVVGDVSMAGHAVAEESADTEGDT